MNEINKADFARKPDGGLAEQIEVLEAMSEGDAENTELLMLLIELRSCREANQKHADAYDRLERRFQDTCSHTYGRLNAHSGNIKGHCANCNWDMNKCQHKVSRQRGDNFCTDCGERLRGGEHDPTK